MDSEYIGVEDVAKEVKLSERATWDLLKRLAVPMLNRHSPKTARFRREAWEEARERNELPPEPRKPYARKATEATIEPGKAAKPKAPKRPLGVEGIKAKLRGARS